jgi:ribosome-associated translation inhibitor RaiA
MRNRASARDIPALSTVDLDNTNTNREASIMQVQFNSDSSVMGTDNVAERIEAAVREKIARFEDKLTRLEIHVRDENGPKGGTNDKACTIEARPSGSKPIGVTEHANTVDAAARKAANTMAQRLERVLGKAKRNDHAARPEKAL